MEKYRVYFKGWIIVEADDADEALEEALDNLHLLTVTDHHEEKYEEA